MPLNAAFRSVIQMASGQTRRFFFRDKGARPCSASIFNNDFTNNAVVQFRSAPAGRDEIQTITAVGTSLAGGTFSIALGEDALATTGAITASQTQATLQANVLAGLANITTYLGLPAAAIRVITTTTSTTGWTIKLVFSNDVAQRLLAKGVGNRNLLPVVVTNINLAGTVTSITNVEIQKGYRQGEIPSSYYADVHPDGYSAAISVVARGQASVAFGAMGTVTLGVAARNLLGPYVDIVCTGGQPMIEFSCGGSGWEELSGV